MTEKQVELYREVMEAASEMIFAVYALEVKWTRLERLEGVEEYSEGMAWAAIREATALVRAVSLVFPSIVGHEMERRGLNKDDLPQTAQECIDADRLAAIEGQGKENLPYLEREYRKAQAEAEVDNFDWLDELMGVTDD